MSRDELTHLTLYEQNCWFMTDQITSSLCIFKLQQRGRSEEDAGGREAEEKKLTHVT